MKTFIIYLYIFTFFPGTLFSQMSFRSSESFNFVQELVLNINLIFQEQLPTTFNNRERLVVELISKRL